MVDKNGRQYAKVTMKIDFFMASEALPCDLCDLYGKSECGKAPCLTPHPKGVQSFYMEVKNDERQS